MKKIFFILFILLSSCFNIFAENSVLNEEEKSLLNEILSTSFLDIPVFPRGDEFEQIVNKYKLKFDSFNNSDKEITAIFSGNIKSKDYLITKIKYNISNESDLIRKTYFMVNTNQDSCIQLLYDYMRDNNYSLIHLTGDPNLNMITHIFINRKTGVMCYLGITDFEKSKSEDCLISVVYEFDINMFND